MKTLLNSPKSIGEVQPINVHANKQRVWPEVTTGIASGGISLIGFFYLVANTCTKIPSKTGTIVGLACFLGGAILAGACSKSIEGKRGGAWPSSQLRRGSRSNGYGLGANS